MEKDASWMRGRIRDAVREIAKAQKRLPKTADSRWWSVSVLRRAVPLSAVPKALFEAALKWIRDGNDPSWLYRHAGRESAYFLAIFAKLETLPEKFRATQAELEGSNERRLVEHLIESIDKAEESYRVSLSSRNDEDHLRAAIEPYFAHVFDLTETGPLRIPADLLFEQWARKNGDRLSRQGLDASRHNAAGPLNPGDAPTKGVATTAATSPGARGGQPDVLGIDRASREGSRSKSEPSALVRLIGPKRTFSEYVRMPWVRVGWLLSIKAYLL